MDGRAIQDFWIVDPSGARKDREVYADLHYFDAKPTFSQFQPRALFAYLTGNF